MKVPRVFSDARRCKKIFKKKTALADPGRRAKAVLSRRIGETGRRFLH
ncbi:hypothetical protein [Rhizobium leguminosarum]|nr:hypothetical protein [Rhizobium leguminosarum]MBY5580249.1 hypothetical protein [Rhizobium leguminosarum]